MCDFCGKRKDIRINPSPLDIKEQPDMALIMDRGIVLLKRHRAFGYMDINYCPICGKSLKE